jgi:hypothetical protein
LGQKIHNVKAPQLTATLRHTLPALGYPHASVLTLKAFRAGHATELGRQGTSLGVILQSGDWKSTAYLAYCNQDEVDAAVFLAAQIEHSDTED